MVAQRGVQNWKNGKSSENKRRNKPTRWVHKTLIIWEIINLQTFRGTVLSNQNKILTKI